MQVFALGKACPAKNGNVQKTKPFNKAATKIMRVMKLTVLLMTVAFLQVSANGFSQTITFSGNNVPLQKVFSVIKEQAGFGFIYFDEQLKDAKKVTINVKNAGVEEVLAICMKDQPYDFTIKAKTIFIINKQKREATGNTISNEQQKGKRINISGKVTGEQGEPVIGATVTIKGTDVATSTNEKGEFVLNDVDEDAVLVVTNVSYQAQEIALRGRSSLDVRLKVSVGNLDEAVVVAYNTTTLRKNTGSISVVKGETIANLPNRSIDRSLQGQVPGLLVTPGNGQPGGGVGNIILRGIGTGTLAEYGSTARNPLFVVDGVPVTQEWIQRTIGSNATPVSNPMANFNPAEIESVTVLKDASSIALYGTRASNGVILITTKKGRAAQSRVNFKSVADISKRISGKVKLLNQEEYLTLLRESYRNLDPALWTDAAIDADLKQKFPTKSDGSFYESPNWFEELYNTGKTFINDLSLSGGTENSNYFLNFSYVTQDGIVRNTGYDRASIRLNIENRPKSWFKVGVNSYFSYNKQNYSDISEGNLDNTGMAYTLSPLYPVRNEIGEYFYNYVLHPFSNYFIANPSASLDYNINQILSYRQNGSAFAEIQFLKNFKLKSLFGFDILTANSKEKLDPRLAAETVIFAQPGLGSIYETYVRRTQLITTNTLRYDKTFSNRHTVNVILGQEAQESVSKLLSGQSQGLAVPYFQEISNGTQNKIAEGSSSKESLISLFTQLNYNYLNKYLFSGSLRRDGSSKFGKNERYGNYWSLGAGWVLSEEKLFKKLPWINYLKLRGSIGTSGNASALNYTTQFYRLSVANYAGNTIVRSVDEPNNEDIKWEETYNTDFGIEANFLNNRIGFSADIYKRKTSNLIYPILPPPTSGFSNSYLTNLGKIENKGVELSIRADIVRNRDTRISINANWSTNKNKLLKANKTFGGAGSGLYFKEGENFGSFYLVKWAGVNPNNGKPQWYDSTGKVTDVLNYNDDEYVGKPQPDGFGGITFNFGYKDFDLSIMFYYQYGYQIYNRAAVNLINDGQTFPYSNQSTLALNRWQKPGDIAENPRRILGNADGGTEPSTRYLYDGDYIRLKTVTLSYNMPGRLLKGKLSGVKLFAQTYNLALWTKYKGSDPENIGLGGSEGFAYPQSRTFTFGLDVTL